MRVRRELEEAVAAAAAAAAESAEQTKVLCPPPCSTRLGLTRHGSLFSRFLTVTGSPASIMRHSSILCF